MSKEEVAKCGDFAIIRLVRENLQLLIIVGIALLLILMAAEESKRVFPEPAFIAAARAKIEQQVETVDTMELDEGWEEAEEERLLENLPSEQFSEWEQIFPADSLVNISRIRRIIERLFATP
ncbi:hypothetical protein HPY86_07400 [candidate division WOR-3 bacterium]|nr:hypothetical protein [candidate division WOR-3 bacterium]